MKLQLHTAYSGSRAVAFELEAVPPAELKKPTSYLLRSVPLLHKPGERELSMPELGRAVIVATGRKSSARMLAELSNDIFVTNWCDKETQRLADFLKEGLE